jgi:uncharacterized protein (DUF983 family)
LKKINREDMRFVLVFFIGLIFFNIQLMSLNTKTVGWVDLLQLSFLLILALLILKKVEGIYVHQEATAMIWFFVFATMMFKSIVHFV